MLILESGAQPGGVLRTVRKDGFLIEESADSFLTALPHGLALAGNWVSRETSSRPIPIGAGRLSLRVGGWSRSPTG